jgi:hypothetical protein
MTENPDTTGQQDTLDLELDEARQAIAVLEAAVEERRLSALGRLAEAVAGHVTAGRLVADAVRAARDAGATWADVGRATGMTRQSAHERWGGQGR